MSVSTSGVELSSRSRVLREAVELLSSMRFSISLLTVICIASVIGTVVKQNEPLNNYVNQFGPFWADVFATAGLFSVYSASWFLIILGFLVASTSLCIARNAPKIVADWRNFKEHVREQSLRAFHHKGEAVVAGPRAAHYTRVAALLEAQGWRARAQVREGGTMIAARKGASNKIGYLAAHGAIVLVCLGGLLDGDLVVRAQMALLGKSAFEGGGLISEVPAAHRLSERNPTFRANLLVPEGQRAGVAVISQARGVVLQELPFDIELKRFIVEYYATGMPKLFASEIVVHDRATGEQIPHRVEVNKPAFHKGIAIYQSSFDDGGSKVSLQAVPLRAGITPFTVEGHIGSSSELVSSGPGGEQKHTLEFKALRLINVENFGRQGAEASGTDVRRVDLVGQLHSRLGSGAQVVQRKELRNVGPSITYRIRDASGQAREFHNYMSPFELEGQSVFLAGLRETPQEPLRYLRIPADEQGRMDGWVRLRQALDRPDLLDKAARRYVMLATPVDKPEMAEQIYATTRRTLALFAGAESPKARGQGAGGAAGADESGIGGLQSLAGFIEHNVPESDRARLSEVLLRILNGSLFELLNLTREQAGLPRLPLGESSERFMAQAVTSLSDSFHYPVPYLFQLADFTQVQASVFQVARAPGKTLVYIGCVALILGVFMMLYVRERRLWIWLQDDADEAGRTRIVTALSSTRRTLQTDTEFERLKKVLLAQEAP